MQHRERGLLPTPVITAGGDPPNRSPAHVPIHLFCIRQSRRGRRWSQENRSELVESVQLSVLRRASRRRDPVRGGFDTVSGVGGVDSLRLGEWHAREAGTESRSCSNTCPLQQSGSTRVSAGARVSQTKLFARQRSVPSGGFCRCTPDRVIATDSGNRDSVRETQSLM